MKARNQNAQREAEIRAGVLKGETNVAIGARLGLSKQRIQKLRHEMGLPSKREIVEQQVADAMAARGFSFGSQTEVAMELGMHQDDVNRICQRLGLSQEMATRRAERDSAIRTLVQAGHADQVIARIMKVSVSHVGGVRIASGGAKFRRAEHKAMVAKRRDRVAKLRAQGKLYKEIAQKLGVPKHTVSSDLVFIGHTRGAACKAVVIKRRECVAALRAEDLTYPEIARALKVPLHCVNNDLQALRKAGWSV